MSSERWTYEKFRDDGTVQHCPTNDTDGSITGHIVFGVKQWFDENPQERIRLGWIKHILHERKETGYDPQTQYITTSTVAVNSHTIEDVHHVHDKSEEMFALEDLLEAIENRSGGLIFVGANEAMHFT